MKRIIERRKQITDWMTESGWNLIVDYNMNSIRSFRETEVGIERISYNIKTATIITLINHPKYGPTYLIRAKISDSKLKMILKNLRVHLNRKHRKGFGKLQEVIKPKPKIGYSERLKLKKLRKELTKHEI